MPCDPVLLECLSMVAAEWAAGDVTRLQALAGGLLYRLGTADTRKFLLGTLAALGIDPGSFLGEFAADPRPPKRKNDRAVRMRSKVKLPIPDGPPPDCLF